MTESPVLCRIAVLVSGSGSNLQALLDACADGFIPGRIVLVLSHRADAYGLERARRAGVPTRVIDHHQFPDRGSFDAAMMAVLDAVGVDLVCLAGFMRILTPGFVQHYAGRLLNIHPSLLPAFPGLHVQQRALDAGARFSGATVHFVVPEVDAGPIVLQAVVPVLPGDDAKTLAARILRQEHRIYPQAVRWFAQGRLGLDARGALRLDGAAGDGDAVLINPGLETHGPPEATTPSPNPPGP
ncbi:MAG: phosphoribosylglycinamide formyltransferase [Magnetococcus sp. WYHC-3]